jgi:rubrerythrin
MSNDDYLKKALLDTQERIRDYMNYAGQVEDERLRECFRDFAETEGLHAGRLQQFIDQSETSSGP